MVEKKVFLIGWLSNQTMKIKELRKPSEKSFLFIIKGFATSVQMKYAWCKRSCGITKVNEVKLVIKGPTYWYYFYYRELVLAAYLRN